MRIGFNVLSLHRIVLIVAFLFRIRLNDFGLRESIKKSAINIHGSLTLPFLLFLISRGDGAFGDIGAAPLVQDSAGTLGAGRCFIGHGFEQDVASAGAPRRKLDGAGVAARKLDIAGAFWCKLDIVRVPECEPDDASTRACILGDAGSPERKLDRSWAGE